MTTPNPLFFGVCVTLALVVCVTTPLAAHPDALDFQQKLRVTDPYLQKLIRDGLVTSPTLRKLVARLLDSDVVVYLTRTNDLPAKFEGRTAFVGQAAGVRYLSVCIAWMRMPASHISTIAHELQHAVEIADAPWVIDEPSLGREFARIGYETPSSPRPLGRAYESDEAIAAGQRVWREFGSKAADD